MQHGLLGHSCLNPGSPNLGMHQSHIEIDQCGRKPTKRNCAALGGGRFEGLPE